MNKCCRCTKRIWPWQKEGNSPVRDTNDRTYFHLGTCSTIMERLWRWLYKWGGVLIPLGICSMLVGGLIAAHLIWFLPKG